MTAPFVRKYNVPLYKSALHVVIAPSITVGFDALPEYLREGCGSIPPETDGATSIVVANNIAVIVRDDGSMEYDTFAHEAVHVLRRLMAYIGMGLMNDDTDEAYAYVGGFIGECMRSAHGEYVEEKRKEVV